MLHGWMILFLQNFRIQMENQNWGTWLVSIKFIDILKYVGGIVMKNANSVLESIYKSHNHSRAFAQLYSR